jgi:membrane protease YdiL (CAAX protease family)
MFSVLSAGEEIGWRGFAQPLLQSRLGWFKGTLVVGLFWGLWHIGAALDPGNVLNRAPLYLSIPLFVLGTIEYSFIYTWLWEKTKGSLLIICFFHGFYDIFNTYASQFFPYVISQYWLQLIAIAFIILWIYGKRFRKLNDETLRQGL